jgi:hypothetical protein
MPLSKARRRHRLIDRSQPPMASESTPPVRNRAIWAPILPFGVLGTDPVRSGTIGARIGQIVAHTTPGLPAICVTPQGGFRHLR